ncbi:hypothetical protein LAZ67_5001931 [Cordylochernes scorpioides]|uniref:Histone-lysine N-methyltransferase SETMAR n=1 Tax=Cordylochernes scorpioides TaxID=51811 RepID=A0ABY6KKT7_9ARAC|nr:hypothetical protein LAZ67_5001931 [Cordylochernes scorpioides]
MSSFKSMYEKLSEKMPSLVNRKGVILLHDNARPHSSFTTQQKIDQLGYEVLAYPPYSPELSPTDFHFFKHLNIYFYGKQLIKRRDVENVSLYIENIICVHGLPAFGPQNLSEGENDKIN